jgi:peptidoglycan/LPS O-acetylase OafA/YrhL
MSILAKREDVQHLRALCVFAVVIFHLDSSFLPNGYLGVDFFFVISGFVVWPLMSSCVTAAGDLDWKKLKAFFRRRIFRLLPALGVVLGLFSLATFLLGMLEDHRSIAAQGIAALLVMANVEAYSQSQGSYFHPNPNPLLHTWSLSAEEQVYLLVATALVLSTLLLKRKVKFLMVCVGIL